jgi:hypothetical protein
MHSAPSRKTRFLNPWRLAPRVGGGLGLAALVVLGGGLSVALAAKARSAHTMVYKGKTAQCDDTFDPPRCGGVAIRVASNHRELRRFKITWVADCQRGKDLRETFTVRNLPAKVHRASNGNTYITFKYFRRSEHHFDNGLETRFRVRLKGRLRPGRTGSGTFSAIRRLDPGEGGEPERCTPKGPDVIKWSAKFE